jgi:DNA-binding MarR family transcriptional regulator
LPLGAREVEQGKVLYLAGENPDDVRMRWIKLCEEMGLDATTDAVFWREGTMLLGNSNLWQLLIQDCRVAGPFALVVIDTAAAYYTGQDENDNVQAGTYARLLRSFTKEIAGGPTVLVNTHPPKNAPPENLLPRGGGAFLFEMDGNLTCVKREQIAEVHWLGKFRGVDFAPISFLLTPGTSERLKDSKGREIWTVTAKPLGAEERATHDAANARNENRVLLVLANQPGLSIAEMAQALGWAYRTGEPDKSRVFRALKTLEDDGLAKKRADHWEPTRAGREKAGALPPDRETTEVPL